MTFWRLIKKTPTTHDEGLSLNLFYYVKPIHCDKQQDVTLSRSLHNTGRTFLTRATETATFYTVASCSSVTKHAMFNILLVSRGLRFMDSRYKLDFYRPMSVDLSFLVLSVVGQVL